MSHDRTRSRARPDGNSRKRVITCGVVSTVQPADSGAHPCDRPPIHAPALLGRLPAGYGRSSARARTCRRWTCGSCAPHLPVNRRSGAFRAAHVRSSACVRGSRNRSSARTSAMSSGRSHKRRTSTRYVTISSGSSKTRITLRLCSMECSMRAACSWFSTVDQSWCRAKRKRRCGRWIGSPPSTTPSSDSVLPGYRSSASVSVAKRPTHGNAWDRSRLLEFRDWARTVG